MRAPSVCRLVPEKIVVRTTSVWFAPLGAILLFGCAAASEPALRSDLRAATERLGARPADAPNIALDGTLATYVAYAASRSPALRASFDRWRAATHRIAPARRFPDPVVTYAFYAAPVQTRVGPQRHRLGVRQAIPWPTRLSAAADARSLAARAAQRDFEGRTLALRSRIASAWWRLWAIERQRPVYADQATLLATLTETARTRIAVGSGTLAEVAQLELLEARLADRIAALDEMQSTARAALRAAIGAPRDIGLPVADDVPAPTLPHEALDALEQAARAHPRMEAYELRARSHEAQAGAAEADRLPSFVLGLDWIETGEASMPVNGSGDDALLVSVGVRLPLFGQDAAAEAQAAEHAEGDAERAMRQAAENDAIAELSAAWSSVRDSHRRLALYETTLIPQARAAQESVNGAYAASELGAANLITAQRALLEIALEAIAVRAEHGVAWARLEALAGRPVNAEGAR